MDTVMPLFYVLIFPGFLFLLAFALFAEYFDRKVVARLQNRQGPPWYQPLADTIKLLSKEDIITHDADKPMVNTVPLFGLAAVAASFLYVPMWTKDWHFSFQGDLIVVLYLLTIPAFVLVLLGWYSPNPFGSIGTGRVVTQLFGYEVPFALALLAPAIAAQSWRITDLLAYQDDHYWFALITPIAFLVAIAGLVGKLERVPFDIPHAETEIVEGPMTEYTGRKYALLKLMFSTETVVGAVLIAAIFLGGPHLPWVTKAVAGTAVAPLVGFLAVVLKALFIVFLLSVIKAALTRLRIDQMVRWCLTWLTFPILIQILYIVIVGSM
ncbi:MAG TPA: NADH-quinone oxidoreductase subunit H [Armatimonadetes bacterium]|nr:NADH-quinone oxidoreductase subunit H [Armatimonadota bacterium]